MASALKDRATGRGASLWRGHAIHRVSCLRDPCGKAIRQQSLSESSCVGMSASVLLIETRLAPGEGQ
jgi:hypothetical protein